MSTSRRGRPPHDDVLTPTEWRVVHAVQHGMSNREIAARRGVSLDAVKFHVSNVLGKLGLANREALRRWFRVPAASALGRRKGSTMTVTTLGPLAQISRAVRDIKESEAFYGTTLGLPHLYSFGSLAFFDCGGTRLYLTAQEQPGPEGEEQARGQPARVHDRQQEGDRDGVHFEEDGDGQAGGGDVEALSPSGGDGQQQ